MYIHVKEPTPLPEDCPKPLPGGVGCAKAFPALPKLLNGFGAPASMFASPSFPDLTDSETHRDKTCATHT